MISYHSSIFNLYSHIYILILLSSQIHIEYVCIITYTHFYHIPMYISIPSRGMSLLHARLFCLLPSSRTVITITQVALNPNSRVYDDKYEINVYEGMKVESWTQSRWTQGRIDHYTAYK